MPRIVYSTDPDPVDLCPRCGRNPCVCDVRVDVPPKQQTAYVARDRKRRGGKTVTVITGLQHTPEKFRELLGVLKLSCGAGGTMRGGDLEIQGDQRERVAEKLREMGYKVKFSGG